MGLTSSLTLNLGVRYELFFPFLEAQDRMADFIVNRSDPLFGQYLPGERFRDIVRDIPHSGTFLEG